MDQTADQGCGFLEEDYAPSSVCSSQTEADDRYHYPSMGEFVPNGFHVNMGGNTTMGPYSSPVNQQMFNNQTPEGEYAHRMSHQLPMHYRNNVQEHFQQQPFYDFQNFSMNGGRSTPMVGAPGAGAFGQMSAISAVGAHAAGSGQILSDDPTSPLTCPPGGTYFDMATAAPLQQTTDFRNDSVAGPIHQSYAGPFRQFPSQSNVATSFDKGRMTSIGGAQLPQQHSPSPQADAPAGKVAIPALDRKSSGSVGNPSAGPTSGEWNIQPRPKPGRKPMVDDPSSKRKLQNRYAQRAFRDRRAQKVHDLEIEKHALWTEYEDRKIEWAQLDEQRTHELAQAHERISQLSQVEADNVRLRDENVRLQAIVEASRNQGNALPMNTLTNQRQLTTHMIHSVPTPPEDNEEMEVDFTAMYARKQVGQQQYMSMGSPIGTDDHCGFCTEAENCICRQQQEELKNLAPLDPVRASRPINNAHQDSSTPKFLEAPTKASGPGTCDMCLADPEKARQCRELAQAAQYTPSPASAVTLPRAKVLDTATRENDRMTCSDFFTSARQNNVQLGPEHYRRIAHIYPHRHADGRLEHSPAMEMDANDAAHALAALSRQDTMGGER